MQKDMELTDIYDSRNYYGIIATPDTIEAPGRAIYDSRNYYGIIAYSNWTWSYAIYDSRNYYGIIAYFDFAHNAYISTIVEIIMAL